MLFFLFLVIIFSDFGTKTCLVKTLLVAMVTLSYFRQSRRAMNRLENNQYHLHIAFIFLSVFSILDASNY